MEGNEIKMKTIKQIRTDLREIKYYYSKDKDFERASELIGKPTILTKVDLYNRLITKAPMRLYDLYISLYVYNNTLLVISEDWCLSLGYVKALNRKLYEFLLNELNKEEKENV